MNIITKILPLFALTIISGCFYEKEIDVMKPINAPSDVVALFPTTPHQLEQLISSTRVASDNAIKQIIAISDNERTFDNTVRALDTMQDRLSRTGSIASTIMNTNPDQAMRDAAQKGLIDQSNYSIEHIVYNKSLFKAFQTYFNKADQEKLNPEERYFLDQTMDNYKKIGLLLPDEEQTKIKELVKKLNKLELEYENNINADTQEILIAEAELAGLSPEAISALASKTVDGKTFKVLNTSYPIVTNILDHCSVESTRKKVWTAFANRAYPVNEQVLKEIIKLRHQLAEALHYPTYAHLDIDQMMAQTPENVKSFLAIIEPRAIKKSKTDLNNFINDLPEGVTLTADHTIKPWDAAYIKSIYKKKHYNLDNRYIAEFFPVESTLENMFKIYETLLGLSFEQVPVSGLWDKNVTALTIRSADNKKIRGYLLLDLFPRPHKYTHACFGPLTPSLKLADGTLVPGTGIVIANFPMSSATQPALLKHDDVVTFFHEFGHALHHILGATELASFSGTSVKSDFVETPSQMFEEWMWDPEIIKAISKHYKTGKHLPDDIIAMMIQLKNFDSGMFVSRQLALTNMSLDYFMGADKDLQKIMFDYHTKLQPHIQLVPENHFYAAFGHLASGNYGSKYYSYLWAKFYALDLFEAIKEQGLLNPAIGKKLVEKVLGRGGSCPPQDLLRDFLGREPRSDAFFKNLGM